MHKLNLQDREDINDSNLQTYLENGNYTKINLSGTNIKNLSPFKNLTSLVSLHLSNTQVENIEDLSGLINLKYLFLTSTLVYNIKSLENLTNLRELSLTDTKINFDLIPLTKLILLEKLYLNEVCIDSLSILQLKTLTNLKVLEVDHTLRFAKQELIKNL